MPQISDIDFSGYATKYNVKCTDGRVILPDAFQHMNKKTVPLVWRHMRDEPANVLGRVALEHRDDGVYVFGVFNDTEAGKNARKLVHHGDITHLSIYANGLIEKRKAVMHGEIREVSLAVAGANPGALIDYISIEHADGHVTQSEDEAIIYTDSPIVLSSEKVIHADDKDGETIEDVFSSMSDKQKAVVYSILAQLVDDGDIKMSEDDSDDDDSDDSDESDDDSDDGKDGKIEHNDEGDSQIMKKNVFDSAGNPIQLQDVPVLAHDDFMVIQNRAVQGRMSLKEAFMAHEAGAAFLEHAGTYGIGSDRTNLGLLFPDAYKSATKEPTFISRRMEWVSRVIGGTRHVPFSRIKSLHADITADEARARGYITTNQKVEEVFPVLRRVTTPHTVYKKQKLDRDDIIDITDFDVVRWLKSEMRVLLDEELARAVLVGDGRDPVTEVDDHIPTDNIRPVWGDDTVYVYHKQVASTQGADDLIDDMITARLEYRGSGNPDLYLPPSFLTAMLLLKDGDGRRLYRNISELAAELRVNAIIEVPVMENQVRTDTVDYNLMSIMVNLADYTMGADKGGEINFFDDFDIDYNQYKYLLETRVSGALVVPKSAIVLEQAVI